MKAPEIDFHRVAPEHDAIHDRLTNWARVYQDRPGRAMGRAAPMWRFTRNNARMFNPPPAILPPNIVDAGLIERLVCELPYYHREVICWAYLRPVAPARMVRKLDISYHTLAQVLYDARAHLIEAICATNV